MTHAYLRTYTETSTIPQRVSGQRAFQWPARILVFDTETTTDHYQNLTFGFYHIYNLVVGTYEIAERGCFYDPKQLSEIDLQTVKEYCDASNVLLHQITEFIDEIFYPELYYAETLCVGFNLFFDLTRIPLNTGYGRMYNKGAFTLRLSKDPYNPQIRIKRVDGKITFYQFASNKKKPGFKGNFLDLATFVAVLQGKPLKLDDAGKTYNKKHFKQPNPVHGTITQKYIEYAEGDVYCTAELCYRLLKRYDQFGLDLCPTKVYSEASLGKQALKEWNITPFNTLNPDFPNKYKGYLMSAYAGARTECKLRCIPTQVDYTDFRSMYASLFILMNLQDILFAKKIKHKKVSARRIRVRIQELIKLGYNNPEAWKDNLILVKLIPRRDIFPIRARYNPDANVPTLGVNYVTSKEPLWFALQDVLASTLLTGKIPHIIEGLHFTPEGVQNDLCIAEILGENIDPRKDNIVKRLIEKREEYKKQHKDTGLDIYETRQKQLKILINATCYGIYIQLDPQYGTHELNVFTREHFTTKGTYEQTGEYFNPVISVFQVAGARLLLAMGEAKLNEWGINHAYMDTDSILAPTGYGRKLSEYFQPLNPYDFDKPFLEVELENVTFLGISSKRYALFDKKRKPIEKHYKLHGLGHLRPPFKVKDEHWHKEVWRDLLKLYAKKLTEADLYEKYAGAHAISKITISTPEIHKRFKKLNEDKPYAKQIKPGGFLLVGQSTNEHIKPVTPFSDNSQAAPHEQFINYANGEQLKGAQHWKSLAETMVEYAHHEEHKFENSNEKSMMRRRYLEIAGFRYIGKEAKMLDKEPLGADEPSQYETRAMKVKRIASMPTTERRKQRISRQQAYYWRNQC